MNKKHAEIKNTDRWVDINKLPKVKKIELLEHKIYLTLTKKFEFRFISHKRLGVWFISFGNLYISIYRKDKAYG